LYLVNLVKKSTTKLSGNRVEELFIVIAGFSHTIRYLLGSILTLVSIPLIIIVHLISKIFSHEPFTTAFGKHPNTVNERIPYPVYHMTEDPLPPIKVSLGKIQDELRSNPQSEFTLDLERIDNEGRGSAFPKNEFTNFRLILTMRIKTQGVLEIIVSITWTVRLSL
jgi:hypothetical protein